MDDFKRARLHKGTVWDDPVTKDIKVPRQTKRARARLKDADRELASECEEPEEAPSEN